MGDFPVQYGCHAARGDDQVAVTEVAVDEGPLRLLRQVVQEPPGREVDHRLGTAEPLVTLPGLPHLVSRVNLVQGVA